MKKALRFGIFGMALMFGVAACNNSDNGGEVSRPVNDPNAQQQNAQDKMDPLQDQKANQPSSETLPKTSISFEEYVWDFGDINEGDKVTHVFTFTNTGDQPLVLEKCKGSCGCTVPLCPKEPIAPGGTGEIEVTFNSKGKPNKQTKKVTITANTDPIQTYISIKANVAPAPKEDESMMMNQ